MRMLQWNSIGYSSLAVLITSLSLGLSQPSLAQGHPEAKDAATNVVAQDNTKDNNSKEASTNETSSKDITAKAAPTEKNAASEKAATANKAANNKADASKADAAKVANGMAGEKQAGEEQQTAAHEVLKHVDASKIRIDSKLSDKIDDYELTKTWNHIALQASNPNDAKSFLYLRDLTSSSTTNGTALIASQLRALNKSFEGQLGIAVVDEQGVLVLSNMQEFPMMSTMKFPLAYAVLHTMHERQDNLQTKVMVDVKDLDAKTYSPLYERLVKERYVDLHSDKKLGAKESRESLTFTLEELIREAVRSSDNNACDILLTKYLNGPQDLSKFLTETLGIKRIKVGYTEAQMTADEKLSFKNYASPMSVALVFSKYLKDELLSKEDRALIELSMFDPENSKDRIMAGLKEAEKSIPFKKKNDKKGGAPSVEMFKVFGKTGQGAMLDEKTRIAVNDAAYVEFQGKPYIIVAFTKNIVSNNEDAKTDTLDKANKAISEAVAAVMKYAVLNANY